MNTPKTAKYEAAMHEAKRSCPWITEAKAVEFAEWFDANDALHENTVVGAFEQYMDFI